MSTSETQSLTDGTPQPTTAWSAPGKTFLLGEYAVLGGLPAAVMTFGPRFWLDARTSGTSEKPALFGRAIFAAESPAGRLLSLAYSLGVGRMAIQFDDPYRGSGGFGASTAQFALLYAVVSAERPDLFTPGWLECWKRYRSFYEEAPIPPSGADLAAQSVGGVSIFDPVEFRCERLEDSDLFSNLLIFSASWQPSRKAATHTHLADLGRSANSTDDTARALEPCLRRGLEALKQCDALALAQAMNEYGDILGSLGLEIAATRADRDAIGSMKGVLAVKGAGALQADTLVVLIDPREVSIATLIEAVEARDLRFIGSADASEAGVRAEAGVPAE